MVLPKFPEVARHGTVTFCWDTCYPCAVRPRKWTNKWGRQRRSVRIIWLWFAVGWYRMDDYELVASRHAWSE